MDDYETGYQEYKDKLLKSAYFTIKLQEKYNDTLMSEKDYLDGDTSFAKVVIFPALGGLLLGFFLMFDNCSTIVQILIRCVLAVGWIVCFFLAFIAIANYKESCGKSNFYCYVYKRHILDCIREDQQTETEELLCDMVKKLDNIHWRAQCLDESSAEDFEQCKNSLLYIILHMDDFEKRKSTLSRYSKYAKDILDDYQFNVAIEKSIE